MKGKIEGRNEGRNVGEERRGGIEGEEMEERNGGTEERNGEG